MIASPLLREDGTRRSSGGRLGVTFAGVSEHLPTGSPEISRAGLVLAYDMRTLTPRGALKDLSGRGNDGTLMGTELVEGPFGLARGFRDASDYVGLPFDRKLHIRGPISLAAWVRFAQLGVHQHIVAYDDLYTLWIDENDRFRFSDTRGDAFESDPRVVPVGEWAALVATFSGRRGTPLDVRNISIYVNGARAPGRAFGVWNPGTPIEGYVGKESHEGQFHLPFLGEIAAVLVFRRPLSAREALAFAGGGSARAPGGAAAWERAGRALWGPNRPAQHPPDRWSAGEPDGPRTPALETDPRPPAPVPRVGEIARTGVDSEIGGGPWTSGPPWGAGPWAPPRVVRITNILAPYRLPTLEILQGSPLIHFEQWLMTTMERNRKWDPPRHTPDVRIFRDWGLDLSHHEIATAHFNPGMVWRLSRQPPDFAILGGYEQPTCLAAGLALTGSGVPYLLSSESISLGDSLIGRRVPFLARKLVQRSEGVIVPGRASRDHFLALGVPRDRIFLAPNSVDVNRFAPPRSPEEKRAARTALGLPDKVLCLYVGRLTYMKGITDLVGAFRALDPARRNAHLLILGEGPLRDTLDERIAREPSLSGSVSIAGYAPDDRLPEYYRAADIFVFPTRRDIWGLVLNEAMSAGLPVVASDGAAGAPDLIEPGVSGIIVPRAHPDELRDALVRLIEDPGLRDRMGRAARARILNGFTPMDQAMGFLAAILTTLRRLGRIPTGEGRLEAPA